VSHSTCLVRILLVDDDPTMAGLVCAMLSGQPVQLTHAQDGSCVAQLLAEQPFDLALVDLRLPQVSGWEVARLMRFAEPHLRIYLITALHTEHDFPHDMLTAVGADGFLLKPIRRDTLLKLLACYQQAAQRQEVPPQDGQPLSGSRQV
jgi:CheY-like chemotaxis protein